MNGESVHCMLGERAQPRVHCRVRFDISSWILASRNASIRLLRVQQCVAAQLWTVTLSCFTTCSMVWPRASATSASRSLGMICPAVNRFLEIACLPFF